MAVNITVNGRFARHCGGPGLLNEAERVKKELEDERRIKRIQQVREESKNLARKIRNDVAEEKERQLRNLEAIKAQELDCWRQHVLTHKSHDYRTAVFQIGAAHHAAKEENANRAEKARSKACNYQELRKQLKARRLRQNEENKPNKANLRASKSIKCVCTQTGVCNESETKATKRKRSVCFHDKPCYCCYSDSDSEESCAEQSISCSSSGSLLNVEEITAPMRASCNSHSLCQTPAVVLDVEVDSNDSVTLTTPCEIRDNHVANNRQFSRVIRSSPRQTQDSLIHECAYRSDRFAEQQQREKENDRDDDPAADNGEEHDSNEDEDGEVDEQHEAAAVKGKSKAGSSGAKQKPPMNKGGKANIEDEDDADDIERPKASTSKGKSGKESTGKKATTTAIAAASKTKAKDATAGGAAASKTKAKDATAGGATSTKGKRASESKRFTQISDLINKKTPEQQQKAAKAATASSGGRTKTPSPTRSAAKDSASSNMPPPPNTTPNTLTPRKTPYKGSSSGKTSVSGATVTVRSGGVTEPCTSDNVQFYDYNNKFNKKYAQPANAVQQARTSQVDCQPSAMEQAAIEKQLQQAREQDVERLRRRSEERGAKALEREQIRRDCHELTERLDALTRQQPKLLPSDANLRPSFRYADKAARKECQMNTAMEELLLRPAIITCPEVGRPQRRCSNVERLPPPTCRTVCSELNLGATQTYNNDDAYNTASSESCCSILLGYVNDQRNQLRSELNQCETRTIPNHEKADKLKNLLARVDQLRAALLAELKSGRRSVDEENVQQVIDSISDVRKQRENILLDELDSSAAQITQQNQLHQQHQQQQQSQKSQHQQQLPLQTREQELRQKEAILDQKVRDFYEMQRASGAVLNGNDATEPSTSKSAQRQQPASLNEKEITVRTTGAQQQPLEIIIRVEGNAKCVDSGANGTAAGGVAAIVRTETIGRSAAASRRGDGTEEDRQDFMPRTSGSKKRTSAERIEQKQRQQPSRERKESIDSNSTAYRSLPPALTRPGYGKGAGGTGEEAFDDDADDDIATRFERAARRAEQSVRTTANLNPLIAHYVQRLLSMSHNSVLALGASSSEIDTPTSSVINTTSNVAESTDELEATSREKLERVQRFVEENRSFIHELEDSLRAQSNASMETSLRAFEEIWKQRLRNQKRKPRKQGKSKKDDAELKEVAKEGAAPPGAAAISAAAPVSAAAVAVAPVSAAAESEQAQPTAVSSAAKQQVPEMPSTALNAPIAVRPSTSAAAKPAIASREKIQEPSASTTIEPPSQTKGSRSSVMGRSASQERSKKPEEGKAAEANALDGSPSFTIVKSKEQQQQPQPEPPQPTATAALALASKPAEPEAQPEQRQGSAAALRSKESLPKKAPSPSGSKLSDGSRGSMKRRSNASAQLKDDSSAEFLRIATQRASMRHSKTTTRQNKSVEAMLPDPETEAQLERYAQLQENCNRRIAELNEMITKVREEKRELVNATLSSAGSDGARRSPDAVDPRSPGASRHSNVSSTHSQPTASAALAAARQPPTQQRSVSPIGSGRLEKHKPTGTSRDSGISMSRPMTAQGDSDPASYGSQTLTHSSSHQKQLQRPPPTLRRFSPQLAEDELAHELSTIMEVDTPATSRVNNSARPLADATPNAWAAQVRSERCRGLLQNALTFPTFEEYLRQLNFDLSQIEPERSMRIEQQFNELIATLKEVKEAAMQYEQFPTLDAYLQNITQPEMMDEAANSLRLDSTADTVDDLIDCMRMANHNIKAFPTKREYMQQQRTNTPEGELIDTASLENLTVTTTHTQSDTESESINIEAELKRRNIMKSSFEQREQIFSSTRQCPELTARECAHTRCTQSGIEHISTSDNSGEFVRDLRCMGMEWPAAMRRRETTTTRLSSSTSTSSQRKQPTPAIPCQPCQPCQPCPRPSSVQRHSCSQEAGRPLNLRDFLTQELMKHANSNTSTSSTTDESLRNQFFNSIIGTMSPQSSPRCSSSTNRHGLPSCSTKATCRERQKTSTPVATQSSSRSRGSSSGTSGQLFSGESRLSSVHFQDCSRVKFCTTTNENEPKKRPTTPKKQLTPSGRKRN